MHTSAARSARCNAQQQLTEISDQAAAEFSAAVTALVRSVGTTPKLEYDSRRAEGERTRLKADNARLALEMHRQEHGC